MSDALSSRFRRPPGEPVVGRPILWARDFAVVGLGLPLSAWAWSLLLGTPQWVDGSWSLGAAGFGALLGYLSGAILERVRAVPWPLLAVTALLVSATWGMASAWAVLGGLTYPVHPLAYVMAFTAAIVPFVLPYVVARVVRLPVAPLLAVASVGGGAILWATLVLL